MNNVVLIAVYSVLAVVSLVLLALNRIRMKHNGLYNYYQFVVLMLLVWEVMLVIYYASTDIAASRYLYDLNLPFVALTALGWFLYIMRFYGLDSYFPKIVVGALLVIPAFTFALCLTTPLHEFVRSDFIMLETTPQHIATSVRGPWFWVHAAYCYVLLLVSLAVAIYQNKKIGAAYRKPSATLLAGLAVSIAGNVIVLAARTPLDLSLVMAGISSVLLYYAMKNNQSFHFFLRARQEVFHRTDKAIFVLDNDQGIVNMNRTAKRLLAQIGVTHGHSYNDIARQIEARTVKRKELDDIESGIDYYFDSGEVYNARRKPIFDNRQNELGVFLVISDVKKNREVIDYLDEIAGMDILTGLENRRKIYEDMDALDIAENLPLAAIMGDLNNLKNTNDRFGHTQGDIYLRIAAETLKAACPPHAHIARLGGDEFLMLLPQYDAEKTQKLICEIKNAFALLKDYPFRPSIALGYAVKEAPAESLREKIRMADREMYRDKKKK